MDGVMLKPDKKTMEIFKRYSIRNFEKWLERGLDGYLFKKKGIWAFRHVAIYMGSGHTLFQDILHIYNELPTSRSQERFRKAIENLIYLDSYVSNPIIFRELFILACNTEIIKIKYNRK